MIRCECAAQLAYFKYSYRLLPELFELFYHDKSPVVIGNSAESIAIIIAWRFCDILNSTTQNISAKENEVKTSRYKSALALLEDATQGSIKQYLRMLNGLSPLERSRGAKNLGFVLSCSLKREHFKIRVLKLMQEQLQREQFSNVKEILEQEIANLGKDGFLE